ncbi:MAG TPA: response regulator [Lacunisphaera sp.]|nr:response regulator [Lacunisphaera sp.]
MRETRNKTIRVLVVEDHGDDYFFLTMMFAQMRSSTYVLERAESYAAGRAALLRGGYDVGLFDYDLGQGTGIELIREAAELGSPMPILLLTGHQSPEIDEEALQAGAVDFLAKGELNPVQLERAIRYALHQAVILTELRLSQQQLDLFMRSVPCAVAIRGEDGRLLFQNEIHDRFFSDDPESGALASGFDPEPRACVQGGRHWLVNSFAMAGSDHRRLRGFTALDVSERVRVENEHRKTTQLLDSILQNLPVIVGRIDADGRVVEASGRGLEHAGLRPDALPGKILTELYPAAADAVREAVAGGSASCTLSGRHQENEWHADFFVMFDAALGAGATFFGRDISARRNLERWLLTISDEEQQRIGADLHDGLGQQLTGLSCLAAALRDRLAKAHPSEAPQAELIARLANEAVAQSRALARGLCPVQLENAGLLVALQELAAQSQTLHGVQCRFEVKGTPPTCDHLTSLHLYRITQEAIHNAVRHGQARHIRIVLFSRRHQHRLTINDDGKGFDASARGRAPGSGLRLMGYRANIIGGVLSLESRPGGGTRVSCHFTTFANHETHHSRKDPSAQNLQVAC